MDESQSYLGLLGLREQPFAPTADPVYFYATRGHKECLFRLWNGIDASHGIAVVLGNYGTGKTTLLNLISGIYAPTSGSITFLGSDVTALRADLLAKLGVAIGGGIVGSIINAFIGAVILLFLIGLIKRA